MPSPRLPRRPEACSARATTCAAGPASGSKADRPEDDRAAADGPGAYILGWLGCERLSLLNGEDGVAHAFWSSFAKLREWHAAFSEAFGVTPAVFYADFESYRGTL